MGGRYVRVETEGISLTAEQLLAISPNADKDLVSGIVDNREILRTYGISDNGNRLAHFLSQVLFETAGLRRTEENLAYKYSTLVRVFGRKTIPENIAREIAGDPKKIANWVYGERLGNRGRNTEDGWNDRSRGLLSQTTGRAAYERLGKTIRVDLASHPELLGEPKYALLAAALLWKSLGFNEFIDQNPSLLGVSRAMQRLNSRFYGLSQAKSWFTSAARVLAPAALDTVPSEAELDKSGLN